MIEKRAVVRRSVGLHARPAFELAQTAAKSRGAIWLAGPHGEPVDAKSLLMIMSLGILAGEEVTFRAAEPQDESTIQQMVEIVSREGH